MEEKDVERLIVRYLSNEATGPEIERLLEWVSADNKNLKSFNEYINTWSQRTRSEEYDVNAALRRFNNRVDSFENENNKKVFSWSWIGIAASLIFLIIAGAGVYFWNSGLSSNSLEKLTTTSERDTVTLADGTTIYLNRNSTLEYPPAFDGDTRDVFLTGEAFFDVRRNPAKPFIIHTGYVQTQVLGTTFNVNATDGKVSVVVETGKVMVSSSSFQEVLKPNEKLVCNLQTENIERSTVEAENELAWRHNMIIFHDATLTEVANELAGHFSLSFTFENEKVKNCIITGRYKNESVETILKAIEFSTDVRFEKNGATVRVTGNGCDKTN